MQAARLEGRLASQLAAALADEASAPRGTLIPIPEGGDIEQLSSATSSPAGKLSLVETTAAG